MKLNEWLDDIEDELKVAGVKVTWDRFDLLNMANSELNKLTQEIDADCFHVHLNPAVSTVSGTRFYDLPENFGTNFVKGAGDDGSKFCCLLDDGSSETLIDYVSTVQFYSLNLRGEGNGKPSRYTIVSTPAGGKQIALSPTPDASYEIDGLYKPTDWALDSLDTVPAIPGNSPILKYSVLRRISPERWNQDYAMARASLLMELAVSRKVRLAPVRGRGFDEYTLM